MKIGQMRWNGSKNWKIIQSSLDPNDTVQLVLVFAAPDCIENIDAYEALKNLYPQAHIVGGSSAGNVLGPASTDDDMVATAVCFEKSRVETRAVTADSNSDICSLVGNAARQLVTDDLRHILVLSDGLNINGSELAKGVNIDERISVTGGLMGDNGRFEKTFVIANGVPRSNQIVLIGFYGKELQVRHGCVAGWDEFGINRVITKSEGNVVYEIDNQPALELYKTYLGVFANDLPGSGLRFPLSIKNNDGVPLIRTLLAIDEKQQSLTFAGDVPEGSITLLMKGNCDSLIDGAGAAARQASTDSRNTGLAIIISCVGRKMLMDQQADEELEAVKAALGEKVELTGFYSYGELAPYSKDFWQCQLHNQTMTLFTVHED